MLVREAWPLLASTRDLITCPSTMTAIWQPLLPGPVTTYPPSLARSSLSPFWSRSSPATSVTFFFSISSGPMKTPGPPPF
jgi:hypothetical protein